MHSRFDRFRATPLGQQLEQLINTPERYIEFAALSRVEVPAVSAIVHDLRNMFPDMQSDQTAKQFCGAMVAEVMRCHHHDMLRPRGRVYGDYFTYGAVWTAGPQRAAFDALLARLAAMPMEVEQLATAIPMENWRARPDGTGFAVVEHLCHMRDLDRDVYLERIERLLTQDMPSLASVDGVAMAAQGLYLEQDCKAALEDFKRARTELVARLAATTAEQRNRHGVFDGVRRITLAELIGEIDRHDRTHLLELDELEGELASRSRPDARVHGESQA